MSLPKKDEQYITDKVERLKSEINALPEYDLKAFVDYISAQNFLWPMIFLIGWYKKISLGGNLPTRKGVDNFLEDLNHQISCGCGSLTKNQKEFGMTEDDVHVESIVIKHFLELRKD